MAQTPAGANNVQTLNANFMEMYTKIKDLVPNNNKFLKAIPFSKGEKLGNALNEPVVLG